MKTGHVLAVGTCTRGCTCLSLFPLRKGMQLFKAFGVATCMHTNTLLYVYYICTYTCVYAAKFLPTDSCKQATQMPRSRKTVALRDPLFYLPMSREAFLFVDPLTGISRAVTRADF